MENPLVITDQKPQEIIRLGEEAAKELTKLIKSRKDKLIINNRQYLCFEDWQTLGKFYGLFAKVTSSDEIWNEDRTKLLGFKAHAIAAADGMEISGADAECTFSEPNWKNKPRFQLRSMAQTRACAKALRNCLGWVAVLGGYESTPAEEIDSHEAIPDFCTIQQRKKIFVAAKQMGWQESELRQVMLKKYGTEHTHELTKQEASDLIEFIEKGETLLPDD